MRVTNTIPQDDLRKVPAAVRAVEAAGYDGLFALENRHNPFLPLAIAAVNSTRIELATGIAIAFARSPMTVANIGWDLQGASGGRFVIGLGSQVKGHNERRFSVPWSPPAPRMREYVLALGRLGGHLNHKCDGLPGWQTLWRGAMKLHAMMEYELSRRRSGKL